MHKKSVIVHEYFYEGGPETFEYLLPVSDLASEHEPLVNKWLRQFADAEPSVATEIFHHYLTEISIPELRPWLNSLSRLAPFSIVVHKDRAWLRCKLVDNDSDVSARRDMILLPTPNENVNWPPSLSTDSMAPLRHFLRYFAGTKTDIPPTAGFLWTDQCEPAIEDPETFAWKNIKSWQNSLPIYLPGNGDAVLVGPDGRFGKWDHEMTNQNFVDRMVQEHGMERPDDGAVFLIGNFTQFVSFIVKDIGL